MIILEETTRYQKELKKFTKGKPKFVVKIFQTLQHFIDNPQHPSLNIERLAGSDVWTMRIDKGNRIYFTWINENSVLLIDIGSHDKYRLY
ncbi:MAG TPA: hypothetical protein VJC17_01085 [Candidatus Dojkabacteria bacterium]|nr:hypothetical protein [Candidatus Dojkabacteria bacterium]